MKTLLLALISLNAFAQERDAGHTSIDHLCDALAAAIEAGDKVTISDMWSGYRGSPVALANSVNTLASYSGDLVSVTHILAEGNERIGPSWDHWDGELRWYVMIQCKNPREIRVYPAGIKETGLVSLLNAVHGSIDGDGIHQQ